MEENECRLTDKDLHCIARTIQDALLGENAMCLYCRYAFQCSEQYKVTRKAPFDETQEKLQKMTGVNIRIYNPGTKQKDILAGSWIEKFPELLKQFTSMSFEEQQDILRNPDILQYEDSWSVGKRP